LKTAVIFGVTGQDGGLLASHLLALGYKVIGTTRQLSGYGSWRLDALGISQHIKLLTIDPLSLHAVVQLLEACKPNEVYYLASQSSVSESFSQPLVTIESSLIGVKNVLDACLQLNLSTKIYNAGSSESFGDLGVQTIDESTPFSPVSPYGLGKAKACDLVKRYRADYGLFACNGLMFNHESSLRDERFVSMKIAKAVNLISFGRQKELVLGDLDVIRDWGWAPEYVIAMHGILQLDIPLDFVIATGKSHSLREFVSSAFSVRGLDWSRYVRSDLALSRPAEIKANFADPTLANRVFGWKATVMMREVASRLVSELTHFD
jgi:GDPmannose 4,6-dehydratase